MLKKLGLLAALALSLGGCYGPAYGYGYGYGYAPRHVCHRWHRW